MTNEDLDDQIAGIAALAEPQRRHLYRYVVSRDRPVGKDEAARELGLARSVAGFHLDRLVAEGLLVTEYRRLSGRSGPGAGRPAKLYRRSDRQITVHIPDRRYGLAASLLAAAVSATLAAEVPVDVALRDVARDRGRRLGETLRTRAAGVAGRAGERAGPERWIDATLAVLDEEGYEPRRTGDEVVMANCPFHVLVEDHRSLVCGMNLDLLDGMVGTVPDTPLSARLHPSDGHCCVRLTVTTDE